MKKFEYARPVTVKEVLGYLDETKAMVKAGGVDVLDLLKEDLADPVMLVNIRDLEELTFVRVVGRSLSLGPAVTLGDLADHRDIKDGVFRALAQAALGAATPQIRNMATVGGNLCQRPRCWYFRNKDFDCARKGGAQCFAIDGENQYHAILGNQDGCVIVHPSSTAVALMAFDARLKIISEKDEREIALADFFVAPAKDLLKENILKQGELIAGIKIAEQPPGVVSYYHKLKEKQSFDAALAEVAVALDLDGKKCRDARVILGAAAPVPWRAQEAESILKGQSLSKDVAKKAAEAAVKEAKPLSRNAYKVDVFKAVITRTICWAAGLDPSGG